jgi:hypothetical protein
MKGEICFKEITLDLIYSFYIHCEFLLFLNCDKFLVADLILGINISRTFDGLILSQSHYIKKVLEKFRRYDDILVRTPVDVNLHLTKNKGNDISQLEYSRIIGSVMYIMNCTRPDIAYSVSKLRRYIRNPREDH